MTLAKTIEHAAAQINALKSAASYVEQVTCNHLALEAKVHNVQFILDVIGQQIGHVVCDAAAELEGHGLTVREDMKEHFADMWKECVISEIPQEDEVQPFDMD